MNDKKEVRHRAATVHGVKGKKGTQQHKAVQKRASDPAKLAEQVRQNQTEQAARNAKIAATRAAAKKKREGK